MFCNLVVGRSFLTHFRSCPHAENVFLISGSSCHSSVHEPPIEHLALVPMMNSSFSFSSGVGGLGAGLPPQKQEEKNCHLSGTFSTRTTQNQFRLLLKLLLKFSNNSSARLRRREGGGRGRKWEGSGGEGAAVDG